MFACGGLQGSARTMSYEVQTLFINTLSRPGLFERLSVSLRDVVDGSFEYWAGDYSVGR